MLKTSIILLFLISAITLHFALNHTGDSILPGIMTTEEEPQAPLPFTVAINPTTRAFDEKGEVRSVIHADKVEYFKPNEQSESEGAYSIVTLPRLGFFEDDYPWNLTAQEGLIDSNSNELLLTGDVKLNQVTPRQGETLLTTEELLVFFEENHARTDETVTISAPLGELQAQGMRIDFTQEKIELLSRVRGQHDPI